MACPTADGKEISCLFRFDPRRNIMWEHFPLGPRFHTLFVGVGLASRPSLRSRGRNEPLGRLRRAQRSRPYRISLFRWELLEHFGSSFLNLLCVLFRFV